MTSHFMDEVEALCDEICILKQGETVFYGTVEDAIENSPCDNLEDAYLWYTDRREQQMKTFKAILKTELKLSLRGMDMIIFAICMPVVVLLILGFIYGNKPAFEGADYSFLEQSFAALTTISICAGGVMGLPLVVSDYRSRHILKRFKVTPVSPVMILFVQTAVYTIYAVVSLLLLYIIASVLFGYQIREVCRSFLAGLLVMVSHVQHRHAGRDRTKHENSRRDCQYFIFSHVDLFRCNAAL